MISASTVLRSSALILALLFGSAGTPATQAAPAVQSSDGYADLPSVEER